MTRYDMADAMRNVIDEQREDITALKAENAKLRELVRDTVETLGPPALHVDNMECGTIYAAHISRLEQRMRELGIEVDE